VFNAGGAYVEPFFELIRSVISRLSARFGSKFCGSHACTVTQSACGALPAYACPCRVRTYEALQRRCRRFAKCAVAVAGGHASRCCLHCRRGWRSAGVVGKHGCARVGDRGVKTGRRMTKHPKLERGADGGVGVAVDGGYLANGSTLSAAAIRDSALGVCMASTCPDNVKRLETRRSVAQRPVSDPSSGC
jgi:hypothetical protein